MAVKHYSQNVKKGEEIIEFHISELAQEGVTFIPRFNQQTVAKSKQPRTVNNKTMTNNEESNKVANSNLADANSSSQCDNSLKNGLINQTDEKASTTNGCLHSAIENVDTNVCDNSFGENNSQSIKFTNNSNNSSNRSENSAMLNASEVVIVKQYSNDSNNASIICSYSNLHSPS